MDVIGVIVDGLLLYTNLTGLIVVSFSRVMTGSEKEAPLAESIASQISGARSIAGRLPLRSFAALIEKLDLFITNDTGPMHLSFAMETPTVALFSPTDPYLCGPYQCENAVAIKKRRACTPCLKKKCRLPFCMEQISPHEVYESLPF